MYVYLSIFRSDPQYENFGLRNIAIQIKTFDSFPYGTYFWG